MDVLKEFGIDPILVAAQIVNFLIILWLLKRFAYKPIFQMLEKRKRLIANGVEDAQKADELLKKTEEKEKELLKKAHATSQEVLTDAQEQAQETLNAAEEQAKVRVAKMLDDAKREIAQETDAAQKQLSKHTAQLAVEILEKSLHGMVDTRTQKEIVAKSVKRLRA